MTFIDKCIAGIESIRNIDSYVDDWHQTIIDTPLIEFLGMTENEYNLWLTDPSILPYILIARYQIDL